MSESEFLALAEAVLDQIESGIEHAADEAGIDLECSRTGNVLQIEFLDNDSKIIVNTQAPMQEIWVAAKSGGYHYRLDGNHWMNTRDGTELFASLSDMASAQAQALLRFSD